MTERLNNSQSSLSKDDLLNLDILDENKPTTSNPLVDPSIVASSTISAHDGDIGNYLRKKHKKVNEQLCSSLINQSLGHAITKYSNLSLHSFADVSLESSSLSIPVDLFSNVRCWVNGFTSPPVSLLNILVCTGGGSFELHPHSQVTHIICSTLPLSKVNDLKTMRKRPWVITGQWVVDCVREKRRVSETDYLIDCVKHLYTVDHKWTLIDNNDNTNIKTVLPPASRNMASVAEYFHSSRLHFIGGWKERHLHTSILPLLRHWVDRVYSDTTKTPRNHNRQGKKKKHVGEEGEKTDNDGDDDNNDEDDLSVVDIDDDNDDSLAHNNSSSNRATTTTSDVCYETVALDITDELNSLYPNNPIVKFNQHMYTLHSINNDADETTMGRLNSSVYSNVCKVDYSRNIIVTYLSKLIPDFDLLVNFPLQLVCMANHTHDNNNPNSNINIDGDIDSHRYDDHDDDDEEVVDINVSDSDLVFFHVDMDSFFVSSAIAAINRDTHTLNNNNQNQSSSSSSSSSPPPPLAELSPDVLSYYQQPVVIAHGSPNTSNNNSSSSSTYAYSSSSTSSISSCNAVARCFGISADMPVGSAFKKIQNHTNQSPNATVSDKGLLLNVLSYDFNAYTWTTELFYSVLCVLSLNIVPVSIDEGFVTAKSERLLSQYRRYTHWAALSSFSSSSSPSPCLYKYRGSELERASAWYGDLIRATVLLHTHCLCSIGIAQNQMVARIATQFAKPLIQLTTNTSVNVNVDKSSVREWCLAGSSSNNDTPSTSTACQYRFSYSKRSLTSAHTTIGVCVTPLKSDTNIVSYYNNNNKNNNVKMSLSSSLALLLASLSLSVLPGVGRTTAAKLKDKGFTLCKDIQNTTTSALTSIIGSKNAASLYYASFGIKMIANRTDNITTKKSKDDNPSLHAENVISLYKSTHNNGNIGTITSSMAHTLPNVISVEMSWGVRPHNYNDVKVLASSLLMMLFNKLVRIGCSTAIDSGWMLFDVHDVSNGPHSVYLNIEQVSIMLMVKSIDAPPPSKYLGHGHCDTFSKSEKQVYQVPVNLSDFKKLVISASNYQVDPILDVYNEGVFQTIFEYVNNMIIKLLKNILVKRNLSMMSKLLKQTPDSNDVLATLYNDVRGMSLSFANLNVTKTVSVGNTKFLHLTNNNINVDKGNIISPFDQIQIAAGLETKKSLNTKDGNDVKSKLDIFKKKTVTKDDDNATGLTDDDVGNNVHKRQKLHTDEDDTVVNKCKSCKKMKMTIDMSAGARNSFNDVDDNNINDFNSNGNGLVLFRLDCLYAIKNTFNKKSISNTNSVSGHVSLFSSAFFVNCCPLIVDDVLLTSLSNHFDSPTLNTISTHTLPQDLPLSISTTDPSLCAWTACLSALVKVFTPTVVFKHKSDSCMEVLIDVYYPNISRMCGCICAYITSLYRNGEVNSAHTALYYVYTFIKYQIMITNGLVSLNHDDIKTTIKSVWFYSDVNKIECHPSSCIRDQIPQSITLKRLEYLPQWNKMLDKIEAVATHNLGLKMDDEISINSLNQGLEENKYASDHVENLDKPEDFNIASEKHKFQHDEFDDVCILDSDVFIFHSQ